MIFTKMHGLGNDYVCINCFRERVEDPPGFARTLCDRHYGIGADGLILICPSKVSDFKMEIVRLSNELNSFSKNSRAVFNS